ncbi:hypothetical protein [Devosia elaeis]|uniref:Deoxynucleotide monophosphate kinase n=1 Tax=Devosia elaeis TaxID=1770058 RepID=A0A178HLT2_9HYPH|nr:hypothetical protein [Devosia elaeis]OAM73045.1 hypothetical protein A3840_18680 [Devosia elaeis]
MRATDQIAIGTPYTEAEAAGDNTFARQATPTESPAWRQWHRPPLTAANDNNPVRVIGLMGYGGAGKSEVARILVGHGFVRTHIKAPLRAMAATLLTEAGYMPHEVDDYLDGERKRDMIPTLGRSGTEVQQFLGTEFGRDFCYADLWLDLWRKRAKSILADGGKVVQESVRFPNEAEAIRELGGLVIRVERPGVGPLSDHVSERPPAEPDLMIHNNGTLTDLALQVATALRRVA